MQLLTIWFGANDAVLADRKQYVPLDRFKANLRTLATNVRDEKSKWYSPATRVVLISPPPIIESDRLVGQFARWRSLYNAEGPEPTLDREWGRSRTYAEAVVDTGKEIGVPTVDLWNAIIRHAGGETPEQLRPYF